MGRVSSVEQLLYQSGEWDDLSTLERSIVERVELELIREIGMDPEYAHELALSTLVVCDQDSPGFDLIGRARRLHTDGCEPGLIYRLLR